MLGRRLKFKRNLLLDSSNSSYSSKFLSSFSSHWIIHYWLHYNQKSNHAAAGGFLPNWGFSGAPCNTIQPSSHRSLTYQAVYVYWIESIRRQHPRNFSFLLHASQTLRAIKDIAIGSAKHHEVHQFLHTHFESMDFKSDVCKHLWRTGKNCRDFEVDSALPRISKSMLLTHFNTAQLATSCTWVQYPWPPIIAPDFGSSKSRSLQPSTPRVLVSVCQMPLPLYLCKRFAICSISLLKH